jgi:hypothetical protein
VFGHYTRSSGPPAGCHCRQPAENFIRSCSTEIFTAARRNRRGGCCGNLSLKISLLTNYKAYYYLMVIGFFLYQTFKEDTLQDILPLSSYATTVRRLLIDIAAKVVRTGHEVILKVTQAVMDRLKLQMLWTRCQNPVPIPIPT